MSSNIRVRRICEHCKQEFIARTTVTKYCGDNCAKRAYKAKVRQDKIKKSNREVAQEESHKPAKSNQDTYFALKTLDYLTIAEAATLLKCGKRTIYRMINTGRLRSVNLATRRTRILKADIDSLFKITEESQQHGPMDVSKIGDTLLQHCISIGEILKKYKIADASLREIIRKNEIPKFQKGKYVYVPKHIIEPILCKIILD